jgi:pyruvate dehydrogenase E1 component alpha subunit
VIAHTYRFLGHHVGDPLTYRDKREPDRWRRLDPIPTYGGLLVQQQIASAGDLETWSGQAVEAVSAAVEYAETSPEPDPAGVMEGLFS